MGEEVYGDGNMLLTAHSWAEGGEGDGSLHLDNFYPYVWMYISI